MEMFGNEIRVQQGEDWNLDILLSASDIEYIPFIISNQRKNPFFVVTVASTKYEKNLRYVASWWNNISKEDNESGQTIIPTFYQTVPYFYGNLTDISQLPSLPPDINGSKESKDTRLLYQYTLDTDEEDTDLGHKPYHYFYFEYNDNGDVTQRIDTYECRIRFNFASSETSKWGSQNYLYQITLVSGELLQDVLANIAISKGSPSDWPSDTESQYNYVKSHWPGTLQPDIDSDSPLGFIDNPQVILQPSTLQVYNNLRQII